MWRRMSNDELRVYSGKNILVKIIFRKMLKYAFMISFLHLCFSLFNY